MSQEEKNLVLDKSYTCPVCEKKIKAKAVKTNVAKFVDTCADLRPIYSNINVSKYDVVSCPHCGYTALTKNFDFLTQVQRKLVRENISDNFKPREDAPCDFYTTEQAITRLKLALLCTMKKGGKSSEIGGICLKMSWIYQDMIDEIAEDDPQKEQKTQNLLAETKTAHSHAYQYLTKARMEEDLPIAGMNDVTLDYLLAYLAYCEEEYNTSMQLLSGVITSRSSTPRLKDKAVTLKEMVQEKLKS